MAISIFYFLHRLQIVMQEPMETTVTRYKHFEVHADRQSSLCQIGVDKSGFMGASSEILKVREGSIFEGKDPFSATAR